MKQAVLFDLGNTLVYYWERPEFPALLEEAILAVRGALRAEGLLSVPKETMWQRVEKENHEAEDHQVRPLAGRLGRIFQIEPEAAAAICRTFTQPFLDRGRLCVDTIPVLKQLRSAGIATALVSNTPWGSPGSLWRAQVEQLGLGEWLESIVFCTDVGWRKPARPIFEHVLAQLRAEPQDCLFVGDEPRWDLDGPRSLGMEAVLIDRRGTTPVTGEASIPDLYSLLGRLGI
jgi:putative hydrolase of the HAD superfamily